MNIRLLLDTCAVIFFVEGTGDPSRAATDSIQATDSEVFVSAVSVGELACAGGAWETEAEAALAGVVEGGTASERLALFAREGGKSRRRLTV